MNWYEKLSQYFPIQEMKSKEHMEMLLKEKGDIYYKDEGPNHVMMYVEMEDFLFIDYVFVSKNARGQGLGHKLIQRMKEKQKPIILEVEPVDYEDTDTQKRLHFYKREGFKHAESIGYERRSLATNEITKLEILYWSPNDEPEKVIEKKIYEGMKKTYEMIHTYKDKELYGKSYQDVEDVLSYDTDTDDPDILSEL